MLLKKIYFESQSNHEYEYVPCEKDAIVKC